LRAEYEERRVRTNLCPPGGRPPLDLDVHRGDKSYMTYWYDDGTKVASLYVSSTFLVLCLAISYGSIATCPLCQATVRSLATTYVH
jgi:hypothetical protein